MLYQFHINGGTRANRDLDNGFSCLHFKLQAVSFVENVSIYALLLTRKLRFG